MSSGNLVSVILAGDGDNLTRALRSALRQTHTYFEVLLAGDASASADAEAADDDRVSLVPVREGASDAEARNAALACARGRFIAYLTPHCAWYPYHLECLLEAMADAPDRRAAVSRLYRVRRRDGLTLEKRLPPAWAPVRDCLFRTPCVELPALCHHRDLLDQSGTFDAELPSPASQWDFARRLAFYTDFVSLEDVTGELTESTDNEADRTADRFADVVRAKQPPRPWSGLEDVSAVLAPAQPDSPADGLALARRLEREGNWRQAVRLYEQLMTTAEETNDLKHLAANALYRLGEDDRALELCREVNECRPTVDSLLLEARLHRRGDNDDGALEVLQHAEQILSWKG
ncbi:MAG: glycosyltransferase [Phycisphaerae bacterium]